MRLWGDARRKYPCAARHTPGEMFGDHQQTDLVGPTSGSINSKTCVVSTAAANLRQAVHVSATKKLVHHSYIAAHLEHGTWMLGDRMQLLSFEVEEY